MSAVTTHILDTSCGRPAAGVSVRLALADDDGPRLLGQGVTDSDGRLTSLLSGGSVGGLCSSQSREVGIFYCQKSSATAQPVGERT